jgi:REP element-mobilizing transposase RayT
LDVAGGVYHVTARGNEKKAVFRDDADRYGYLDRLIECCRRFEFRVYAYCLMENHVHLAIERGPIELSRIMLALHATYAQRFNRRHGRVGHLFQGRYKAFFVEKDEYLLTLVRYIHMNPVRARIAPGPESYSWSSDRFYRGHPAPKWLDTKTVMSMLGGGRSRASAAYRQLMAGEDEYEALQPRLGAIIGTDQFAVEAIRRFAVRPEPRRWSISSIAAAAAVSSGLTTAQLRGRAIVPDAALVRSIAGYVGREYAGLPVSRMARFFGRDESTLARTVLRLEAELPVEPRLKSRVRDVIAVLEGSRLHG